jgi:hypothetical protein
LRDFLAAQDEGTTEYDYLRKMLTETLKHDPCGLLNSLSEGNAQDPYTFSSICLVNQQAQVTVPVCVLDTGCFGVVQNTNFARALNPPTSASNIQRNRRIGLRLEEEVNRIIGGIRNRYFPVGERRRFVDIWDRATRTIFEVKSGYTSLTNRIREQIARDVEIIRTGRAEQGVWVFRQSPTTGQIGASDPLIDALGEAGITVAYYP